MPVTAEEQPATFNHETVVSPVNQALDGNLTAQVAATEAHDTTASNSRKAQFKKWFKRVGILGFLFFLIKGLVWIAVFYFGANSLFD